MAGLPRRSRQFPRHRLSAEARVREIRRDLPHDGVSGSVWVRILAFCTEHSRTGAVDPKCGRAPCRQWPADDLADYDRQTQGGPARQDREGRRRLDDDVMLLLGRAIIARRGLAQDWVKQGQCNVALETIDRPARKSVHARSAWIEPMPWRLNYGGNVAPSRLRWDDTLRKKSHAGLLSRREQLPNSLLDHRRR